MPGGQVASAWRLARAWACAPSISARWATTSAGASNWKAWPRPASILGVKVRRNCATQSAYIIVDASTGERTVFWRRDDGLRIAPSEIADQQIACGRLLHIDGHDTGAVARAAGIARAHGIPVTVDVDTIYQGFERVLRWSITWSPARNFPPPGPAGRTPSRPSKLCRASTA